MKCQIQLLYRKLCVYSFLSTVVIISFFASSNTFQNQFPLAYSQHNQNILSNNSHYTYENDISNTLLEQFKAIVFDKASSNNSSSSSINRAVFNSSITVPIVVGIVTPNGTQVSGYGNISNFNFTKVDGNTVFDIASISKTFVAIILADMVDQGLVNLNDPIEKYFPVDNVKSHRIMGTK